MAIIRRPKAVSGFMYEASVISQVTSEIETAFANCMGKGVATFRLGNVWFDLQTERLSVLFGRSKSRIEMLASNLVFQRVFRQGHDCGVFCQSPKDFVRKQMLKAMNILYQNEKITLQEFENGLLTPIDFSP